MKASAKAIFTPADRRLAEAVSALIYLNPFLPERIEHEQTALGAEFDERHAVWNVQPGSEEHPNVVRLVERAEEALRRARRRLLEGRSAEDELALYQDMLLFVLYYRHRHGFDQAIADGLSHRPARRPVKVYDPFLADSRKYLHAGGRVLPLWDELPHVFACFFQIRRAFVNIFNFIAGASRPAVGLRAAIWQSIFTHDMRRYRRILYRRMADYTTLVTGPSGTGKELVARAVGLSRYIPFDPEARTFDEDFAGSFFALNLSALSPTLIESELFGHKRGAFTGAVSDRAGWLEICPPLGTVFLDEIGDLDPTIQVKLLRVLESRTFSRLGESQVREFHGKIIAATHRDLGQDMRQGRFREDMYYRLCSDIIVTPSLRERLADKPGELRDLIEHLARRIVGEEALAVAGEVETWIEGHLERDYDWPGNVRELEQCVRNVLIRRQYLPLRPSAGGESADPREALAARVRAGTLTAEELLRTYCTLVYAETGSYERCAGRLGLDRRTIRARIDRDLLERLKR